MRKSRAALRRSGFTIIEAMFAIFVMGLSAVILGGSVTVASRSSARSRYRNIALARACAVMDHIMLMNASQITPANLATAGIIGAGGTVGASLTCTDKTASTNDISSELPQGTQSVTINNLSDNVVEVIITVTYVDNLSTKTIQVTNRKAQL